MYRASEPLQVPAPGSREPHLHFLAGLRSLRRLELCGAEASVSVFKHLANLRHLRARLLGAWAELLNCLVACVHGVVELHIVLLAANACQTCVGL
jgi:hypothetical protein